VSIQKNSLFSHQTFGFANVLEKITTTPLSTL